MSHCNDSHLIGRGNIVAVDIQKKICTLWRTYARKAAGGVPILL